MNSLLRRPAKQPVPSSIVLAVALILLAVIAVTAGFYHQRWQNQVKAYKRLQQKITTPQPTPLLDQRQVTQ
jgi:hypothetical protein